MNLAMLLHFEMYVVSRLSLHQLVRLSRMRNMQTSALYCANELYANDAPAANQISKRSRFARARVVYEHARRARAR